MGVSKTREKPNMKILMGKVWGQPWDFWVPMLRETQVTHLVDG